MLKRSHQRAKNGYCDYDVGCIGIDVWFAELMPRMIRELKEIACDDGKKLYCLKQRIPPMKNRLFSFAQKFGLCGSCVILCCATGGNKNERNK